MSITYINVEDMINDATKIIDDVHEAVINEMDDISFHYTMNNLIQAHIAQEYITARTLLTHITHGVMGTCVCRTCTK